MSAHSLWRKTLAAGLAALLLVAAPVWAGAYDDMLQAMEQNDVATVMRLLQRGMDVNTSDRSGNTLLMLAARNGEETMLDYLLQNRANLSKRNKYGDTALMLAALAGRLTVVEKLVTAGAEVDPPGISWTPLSYAAFNGHVPVMRFLLDHQAAIDAQAANGATALMIASRNGHLEAVELLLARHADVRLLDRQGKTALEIAKAARNLDIASLLQQAEVRPKLLIQLDEESPLDAAGEAEEAEVAGDAAEPEPSDSSGQDGQPSVTPQDAPEDDGGSAEKAADTDKPGVDHDGADDTNGTNDTDGTGDDSAGSDLSDDAQTAVTPVEEAPQELEFDFEFI
jgi:hypothetical protein